MDREELTDTFRPAIAEILERCRITESFVDREMFQVYMATVWGNAVLDPARSGLEESDLPILHDFLNEEIARVVGEGADVTACYEFIVSKQGEESLTRQGVTQRHREFLHYFARLILKKDVQTMI